MSSNLVVPAVQAGLASHVMPPIGRRLYLDPTDARARQLAAAGGDLNPLSRRLWQRLLDAHPWRVVVDVGVNYGEMLAGVDLPAGAQLIGFEPNPVVRALAARSFTEAGLTVDLRPEAVSAEAGTARFAVNADWSGLSALAREGAAAGAVEVAVTTLDDVLDAALGSDGGAMGGWCAKIDVEGFEESVLAGARRSLAGAGPWGAMLEVLHMPPGLLASLALRHCVLMLEADGQRLTRITADEVEDVVTSGRVYSQDCLLVSGPLPGLLG